MNNLHVPSIVPRSALLLALCLCTAGTAYEATPHASYIESVCLDRDDRSRREVVTVETRLAAVPATSSGCDWR